MQPFFQNDSVTIYNSDCFEIMPDFAGRNFDMVLTDPPYGVTQLEWDNAIDYGAFFAGLRGITRRNTATLVFSQMPMLCDLINANRREFRYEIIWQKTQKLGFLNAKKMPLKAHENILVFYRALPTYRPIKTSATQAPELRTGLNGKKYQRFIGRTRGNSESKREGTLYHSVLSKNSREPDKYQYIDDGSRYPTDVIAFSNWNGMTFGRRNYRQHPTAKPVPLLEYLIKTYTNAGDVVFDPFGGGGSTALAAMLTGRKCVMIEREEAYCELAAERLSAEEPTLPNLAAAVE